MFAELFFPETNGFLVCKYEIYNSTVYQGFEKP